MRIKIVAINTTWRTWDKKILELKSWFSPIGQFQIDLVKVNFDSIPFSPMSNVIASANIKDPIWLAIDPKWYNENISPLGVGYDMVMAVIPRKYCPNENSARGWRTDADHGPVELQISCDENEQAQWPNFEMMSSFFQLARHEILHGLYMISGQYDTTHYYWNLGQIEKARDSVRLPKNYQLPGLIRSLNYLQGLLLKATMTQTPSETIFQKAKTLLGTDASPRDLASDDLACAESVSTILRSLFPTFPVITGTWTLKNHLATSKEWKKITTPVKGCVIMSATGEGNGSVPNGHTGIMLEGNKIASNNSNSNPRGLWMDHWTLDAWIDHFGKKGGYKVEFYQKI